MTKKRRSRLNHKARREGGTFYAIPHAVMDSANWRRCSAPSIKLLMDLARQYNGKNNGDLCATMSLLRERGWSSSDTVTVALRELRHFGFLTLTRQGGMPQASLFGLTWHAIDECGGKLDVMSTSVAPGEWKIERPKFKKPKKKQKATPAAD